MTHAYPDYYVDDVQRELGAMLDYAINICGENLAEFYARFLSSGIAHFIFLAYPKYIGLSGTELALLVAERTGAPMPEKEPLICVSSPEYWTGWTLAYISWYLNLDFGTLRQKGVGAERIRNLFHPFHEADISKTVDYIQNIIQEHDANENALKRQRNLIGMTQEELARLSGIPLRVIRSYEQGKRSLGNAGAQTVMHLCQALSCRMEDVI